MTRCTDGARGENKTSIERVNINIFRSRLEHMDYL
uniref:Uncharacterized protein n=1 Tax=Triticum urartu TaxID=4572 RepID=A0A8R7PE77_TRIUA